MAALTNEGGGGSALMLSAAGAEARTTLSLTLRQSGREAPLESEHEHRAAQEPVHGLLGTI